MTQNLRLLFNNKSGIYLILNKVNRKIYIGSAVNFYNRFFIHKTHLDKGTHKNPYLQFAWNKYGQEAFGFGILEECEIEKLLEREQFWIDFTRCCDRTIGYNANPIAGSWLGRKHRPEAIEKIKLNHVGFRGQKMGETSKSLISIANKKPKSDEHRRKLSIANTGKKHSEECKKKISQLAIGRKMPPGTGAKISKTNKGKINRKFDKWPCPDGWQCRCRTCKDQRNQMNKSYLVNHHANI